MTRTPPGEDEDLARELRDQKEWNRRYVGILTEERDRWNRMYNDLSQEFDSTSLFYQSRIQALASQVGQERGRMEKDHLEREALGRKNALDEKAAQTPRTSP